MCIADLIQGGQLPTRHRTFTVTIGTRVVVARSDNNRFGLVFANGNTGGVFLFPSREETTNAGVVLSIDNPRQDFLSKWHGDIVKHEWTAFGIATSVVLVIELFIPPDIQAKFDPVKTLNI